MEFPRQEYCMGCCFLLQGIFLTQGLNPSLLHWQVGSLPMSHQGSPVTLVVVLKMSSVEHSSWRTLSRKGKIPHLNILQNNLYSTDPSPEHSQRTLTWKALGIKAFQKFWLPKLLPQDPSFHRTLVSSHKAHTLGNAGSSDWVASSKVDIWASSKWNIRQDS